MYLLSHKPYPWVKANDTTHNVEKKDVFEEYPPNKRSK